MEVRYIDNNYNPSQEADQPRKMEGYAILFNVESNVLYDPERKRYFREVIAPYAVTQEPQARPSPAARLMAQARP